MLKRTLLGFIALFQALSLNAQNTKDTIPAFIGYSFLPSMKWSVMPSDHVIPKFMRDMKYARDRYLKYSFDLNSQSSIEGNFGIKRIGIKLGVSADMENNLVGKAYKYGGYIGYKNYWLRIQSSKVSGAINWTGVNNTGFRTNYLFSNSYINIEILKTSNAYKHMSGGAEMNRMLGTFLGLGYTSFSIPMEFETQTTPGGRENQVYGTPAFDPDYKSKFYTFLFGFDMLRQLAQTTGKIGIEPGKPAWHFGMYAGCNNKIGFGSGAFSKIGVDNAHAQNPGYTLVKSKSFAFWDGMNLSTGFRFYYTLKPVFLLAAIGYDLEGFFFVSSSAADKNTDLAHDVDSFILNRGVSFKLYISWVGNN